MTPHPWFEGFVKAAQDLGFDETQTLHLLKVALGPGHMQTLAQIKPSFMSGATKPIPTLAPNWKAPLPTGDPDSWLGRAIFNLLNR